MSSISRWLKTAGCGALICFSLQAQGPIFIPAHRGGGGITVYSGATSLSGTQFFPVGGGVLPSTTEANVNTFAPATGAISNFGVILSSPPGTGNSVVFTWRDAAASQTLTCTIANLATSCSDLTHSFTATLGDKLDIQAVTNGNIAGTPVVIMSAEYGSIGGTGGGGGGSGGGGPVTFSTLSLVLSGGTTPIFVPIGGGGLGSTTEADVQMKVSAVTTFSNVCTSLSTAPGVGNALLISLRDNGANTAVSMTVTDNNKVACDTVHTFTNAAGDFMDWELTPNQVIALFTPDVNIYGQAGSISAGAVNPGTINQTAFYAAAGSTLSGGGPGTAGQCWTSNGVGSPPTFQACSGGGGSVSFAQPYATDGVNFFGPIFQVVKPTDTTWINQNGASETLVNGAAVITRPNIATSTDNVSCRVITNAASTYTLTIGMIGNFIVSANGSNIFAMVGDSGGGRAVYNGQVVFSINTPTLASAVVHSTTFTSNWSAIQQVITPLAYGPVWYRIQDDGANMNFFVSRDGIGFIQIFTEPNTTWLPSSPANQLGFCAEQIGQALGIGMTMTVFHMGITSP